MSEPIRAVAYYRKSDEDCGNSVDQQHEWAHAAAGKEGVEIVREFTDQAKAGWDTARRADFHEMLRFCQEQKRAGTPIDALVCWNANRFSRADSQETAWYIWEFRKVGTSRMLTASRWVDFGRMEDRVLFNIEQDTSHHPYVVNLARDSMRGRVKAAREGRRNGGPVPYGYRVAVDPDGRKRLVPGPEREVEAVRLIFRLYAETEAGTRALGLELKRLGVPSPTGKPNWTPTTIRGILRHPVYTGRCVWNRRGAGRFFTVVDCRIEPRARDESPALKPPEDWIWGEGRHEALVSQELFERCQAKRAGRRNGEKAPPAEFLLGGLMRCGHCGHSMVGRTTKKNHHVYRFYACMGYNQHGTQVCNYNGVRAPALEKATLRKLEQRAREFLAPENVEALRAEIHRQDESEVDQGAGDLRRLRERLADLDRKIQKAADRVLDEEDETLLPELRRRMLERQKERDATAAELRQAEARPCPSAALEAGVDAAVAVMTRLVDSLRADDAAEVRAVLREMVSYVELFFRHEPLGKRTRSLFARGLVYVREDLRLQSTSAPRDRKRSMKHSARRAAAHV